MSCRTIIRWSLRPMPLPVPELAKNMGLGRRGTAVATAQPEVPASVKPAEKPARGRSKQPRKAANGLGK